MQEAEAQAVGLKAVIEGIHSDISPSIPLLTRKLELLKRELGAEFSYDQAMQLYRGADEFAKACGPFDPAYEKFSRDAINFLKYATIINTIHSLGRHEHQQQFKVLVQYKNESAECDVWLDTQEIKNSRNLDVVVGQHLNKRLRDSGMLSHRFGSNYELEFIIL